MSCNMSPFLFLLSCVCSVLSMNFCLIDKIFGLVSESALKTINSPDGDLIDCVAFDQQPAFDHPLFREHKSFMDYPEMRKQQHYDSSNNDDSEEIFPQVWRRSGESCPKNTIPIRRRTKEDVLRASSVKKSVLIKNASDRREIAIGYVKGNISGVDAVINIWSPLIAKEHDVSSSQVWIRAGSMDNGDLNSIEVGYKVVYGDHEQPRLFIYWTGDAYQTTGCYDMTCGGFVQTSNKIALGVPFTPISKIDQQQHEFNISIQKVLYGDWVLRVQGCIIGYWPGFLFPLLGDHNHNADRVEYGGEVLTSGLPDEPHTTTHMGSGRYPINEDESYKRTAFIRNIIIHSEPQVSGQQGNVTVTNQNCYDAETGVSDSWGVHLFYGGPGGPC